MDALKDKDPHWDGGDIIQAYYDSISGPNLIKEALEVAEMEGAAREQWLEQHKIVQHKETGQQKALTAATRVSERVYGGKLASGGAAAEQEAGSAAESEDADAASASVLELTPGTKRARLLQIKHEVREKVQLNESFKSLLEPAQVAAEQASAAPEQPEQPQKKKQKVGANVIGIIKHKHLMGLKDKEIRKLTAENSRLTSRLAEMIVEKSVRDGSANPTLISSESAPTPRSNPSALPAIIDLQPELDKVRQQYNSLRTAAMNVSFAQTAANLSALQNVLLSQL